MALFESILETIGATPLLRLHRVAEPRGARLYAKLEAFNPGGSVKDRIALSMLEAAEAEGRLGAGAVVVEPTTGNTGIGLALACAVKGYRSVIVMPDSMTLERRAILAAFGAEVVLTPAEEGMVGAVRRAEAIALSTPGAFMPQQFQNPANPEVHRRTTAVEIVRALGAAPDAFVAGVGTGGTITGVGAHLKALRRDTRVIAVEPAASAVLSGGAAGPHKLQGIGAGFVPDVLDRAVIDEVIRVDDKAAYDMRVRLAREEGLLVGLSSGAAVHAACDIAARLGDAASVVSVLPDPGHRYFSLDEYFANETRGGV